MLVDWFRAPFFSDVVVASVAVAVELLEQLHALERVLYSQEGILMAREDGLVAS
jgi:hypothetical protein